ncbi:MAG TPA: hypothetical protein VFS18_01240, partial [Actinomycetota bacterium]|nr:hypothetical protein [Actinomycetota bacterium]
SRLLDCLDQASPDGTFEGKLRSIAAEAGLNSVRSAEAVKLLEELGRIEVTQRGRRGRDTIIRIHSKDPVTIEQAEAMLPSRSGKRAARINYDEIGRAVVDRLLELGRDDALRTAQVEAFAAQASKAQEHVRALEARLEEAAERESDLRVRLRAAEETLNRAEENLRRAFGPSERAADSPESTVADDEARAVLDILRSGRG